ncbi:MAG: TVP38/TMEM64 family protein [Culicoidibacterales bacterium]
MPELEAVKEGLVQLQYLLAQWNEQAPLVVPLIGIVVSFLQVYVFFIPTMIIVAMNTVVFGPLIGFFVSLIGIVLGTYSFFFLFRQKIGQYLWRFIHRFHLQKTVEELMSKLERRGFLYVTMLYGPLILIVSPVPVTIAAGLSKIPKSTYIFGLICGETIMIAMATFLGTGFLRIFDNPLYLIGAIGSIFVVTILVHYIQKRWDASERRVKRHMREEE